MAGKIDIKTLPPDLQRQQRNARIRRNKKCIYLNDMELDALEKYCRRFKVTSMTAFFRETIMDKVFENLDDSHPKLF